MSVKNKVNLSKLLIVWILQVWMISISSAQKFSVSLDIILQGSNPDVLILGRYYGEQSLKIDSLQRYPGTQSFRIQKENLSSGVYFVGTKQKWLFDFILTPQNNRFTIRQMTDSFAVEGSEENAAFFSFSKSKAQIEQNIEQSRQMQEMVSRAIHADQDALKHIQESIDRHYQNLDQLSIHYREKYPSHWFSKVLKSMDSPRLPAHIRPVLRNGKANPEARQWYRNHYFDHTNFSDSTLLCNQLWPLFFRQYFISVAHAEPDSFAIDFDRVMARMPANGPIYRYALRQQIESVEQAIYPGQDRVFVHLVDKYFDPEHAQWVDKAALLRMKGKADLHRNNLTGNNAPPLEGLMYADGVTPFRLDSITSPFTLLIFYSPLCHHCMEVLPEVYETWLKYKSSGLNAVVVATDNQFEYWKGFILNKGWRWHNVADPSGKLAFKETYAAYNLPVIYLLDARQRILWKRIDAKNLEMVLSRYITIKQ